MDVLLEEYCVREALAKRQARGAADERDRAWLLQSAALWRWLADQRRRELDRGPTFHVIEGSGARA